MASRLAALLPRFVAVTVIWVLATATLTFASENRIVSAPANPAPAPARPTLVVPDATRQAFVFAKGILQDAGFAWRVTGPVQGFAGNTVASQQPAPGTRVLDTGAPTVVLRLARGSFPQHGAPENVSPYAGTALKLADVAVATAPAAPVAKPKKRAVQKHVAKRVVEHAKRVRKTTGRKPAFLVPGAPKEPQDEISLPDRARRLSAWLTPSRRPTNANVHHWLYQHAWIVTGAKFGWWHGAEALRVLVGVDRRVEAQWGVGYRSEAAARAALTKVQAQSK